MATVKKAPAKKVAAKKGVVAKAVKADAPATPGKAMVSYSEMLAKLSGKAQHEADREANTGAGGTPYMTTEGKNFSIGDNEEDDFGDSFQAVVVASSFLNAWYDSSYKPGSPGVPACYAVAESEDDLAPMDNAPKPQSATCAECPKNEWDSGKDGKGKACGNRRKLCMLLLSDLDKGIVRPVMMSLPPTALKHWGLYVKAVNRQHKMPPSAVVTRFDFDADNPQPCPIPTFEGLVPEEVMGQVFEYDESGEGIELVLQKMDTSGYTEPSKAPARKSKLATKAPAKKTAARGKR